MANFPCEYNARQFFDFSKVDDEDENESFFEISGEMSNDLVVKRASLEAVTCQESSGGIVEDRPEEDDPLLVQPVRAPKQTTPQNAYLHLKAQMRRSISDGNFFKPKTQQVASSPGEELSNALKYLHVSAPKAGSSTTSLNRASRLRCGSIENLNRLAQPKRVFTSADNLRRQEFVSLAQGVNDYLRKTPKRFHSKSRPSPVSKPRALAITEGHTPKLTAKNRNRPIHFQTKEERDLEEIKKFKIKAQPIAKGVFAGPLKAQVQKKPPTKQEPFKLTEVKKTTVRASPEKEKFHARPVPKVQQPFKPVKTHVVTQPETPLCMKRGVQRPPSPKVQKPSSPKPVKLTVTKPKPFSFESRDKQLMKKKEDFILKALEEERRAREFRANPLPPSVVTGKAFEPKYPERVSFESDSFELSTDRRAREREEFEQKLKEKEEILNRIRRDRELLEQQRAEEERQRIRKEAIIKAQPIKKYKELVIKPSLKVTDPLTPKFETDRRLNKENVHHNH